MARIVDEWIGATDDQRAPPRVRERIFTRDSTCHLCKCEIQTGQKWDLDHVTALINGGENRESNLKPAHRKCHVEKTALDVAEKAKVAAIRKKHLGITRPKQTIKSAPFPKSGKPKKAVVYRPVTFYREDTP
ncbi:MULTISPECIES: HNH endonuclease [Rhizobium/Agrobacterium group]|uniref:HNH endonuclease n=1 Tax=Rhizobium oryzihabitans TaxID=2267833 RepID=UPI00115322C7|nr:HNH endonuclease signature motif containing protein [Agrobacterium tumefaciens]TQN55358.1 HNH endonuclease [Agrobacterium tumefaciens]